MLDNNGGFGPNSEANNLWGQDLANGFFSMQSSQDSHQHLFASTIPSVSSNNTTRTQGLPAIQGAEDSPLRAFGLLGTSTTASTTTTAYAPRFAVPPVLGGMPPLSNGEDSDCGVQEIKDAYEFRITGEPSKSSRIENQIRLTFTIQPKAKVCCVPLLHSQCPSRWTTLKLPQDLCNNYHSYDPNSIQQQQTLGPGPGPGTAMGPMHAIATSIPQIGVPTATAAEAAAGTGTGRAGRQGTQLICDTKVYCASRLARAGGSFDEIDEIFCCANCSNRERKTEERKATKKRQKGVGIAVAASSSPAGSAEGMRFTQRRARSIILFCCDSEVPIVKNEFTIPLRLTCYCSHFDERIGFRILFTFTDKASGEVVGSALSEPICIKDEHKNNERRLKRQRANNAAANPASTPGGTPKPPTSSEQQQQQQQQTPGPQQADAHPLRQGALPVEQTLRTFQGHQEEQELTPPPPQQQQQITLPMAASAVGGMNMCMGEGCFVGMKPVLYPPGPMQPPMLQGQVEAPGLYGGNPGFTSFQVSDSTGPTTPEGYYNGAPLFTTAAGSMCNHPVIALPTAGPLGTIVQQQQQQQQQQLGPPPLMAGLPRVMKVVPQDGPVAGGVSVMVAGVGFTPQCTLWFGEYQSHDTQMWNDGAMFCTLPPALRPEVVPVSVNQPQPRGVILDSSVQYFEYRDDTELRMYRQALLTVGGKFFGSSVSPAQVATSLAGKQRHVAAGGPGNGDTEGVVLRALDAANRVRVEGQPERRLDLTLKETGTGRTLLHLAAIKGYDALSLWLMNNDLQSFLVNERDCLGNTPLHYAAFYGHPNTVGNLLRYGADPYAVNNAMVTTFKMARDEGVLGLLQFTGTESCSSSSGGSMSSSPPESANEHSSPIYIAPDACIIESRDVAEEEINGIELTVRTSPQDSPNQHAPQATISSSSSSSSSGLITPLSNANGVEISVSSVDRTEGGSSSSGGGGGVIGFIRKYTRQVVTVGVVALVGLTMVALISFNPKGLIRKAAGDRSYSVDSKQKIPSVADAQKTSLVLRGGSICVLVFSLAFGTTAFVRCKKSVELFVFNIVLAALTVYQIIAIILM